MSAADSSRIYLNFPESFPSSLGADCFRAVHPAPIWRLGKALGHTLGLLFRMKREPEPCKALGQWSGRFLNALGVDVSLATPIPTGGQLWVCNHLSWLDPLVCLQLRPSPALAKAEVADYPLIGPATRRAGLRFVERESPLSRASAVAQLAADLRQGREMLLFPEGTTTLGDELAPLYEGSLRTAYRLNVPVLPLRLACRGAHYPWIGDDSLMPHLWMLARTRRTVVHVHPGTVMIPATFPSEESWIEAIQHHLSPHVLDMRGSL